MTFTKCRVSIAHIQVASKLSYTLSTKYYDKSGNPINGGCLRIGRGCSFVHPNDPRWNAATTSGPSSGSKRPVRESFCQHTFILTCFFKSQKYDQMMRGGGAKGWSGTGGFQSQSSSRGKLEHLFHFLLPVFAETDLLFLRHNKLVWMGCTTTTIEFF